LLPIKSYVKMQRMAKFVIYPKKSMVVFTLILVQFFFGIGTVTSKAILGVLPPLVWASVGDLIAGVLLWLIVLFFRGSFHFPRRGDWFSLFLCAFFGIFLSHASYMLGLSWTTATNASLINTSIPLMTLLIAVFQGKEKSSLRNILGFFIAFLGVLTVHSFDSFSFSDETFLGDFFIFLGSLSTSLYLILSKSFMKDRDPIGSMAWIFLLGGSWLGGLVWIQGFQWSTIDWHAFLVPHILGSSCFSILGGTLFAYLLNFWALAYVQSSSVALFIYLQPVVTGVFAFLFLSESFTARSLLSWFLILLGMVLAISDKKHE